MTDVFLSYASDDRARAGAIAAALEKEGLSVWWDRALIPGDRYERTIDAALSAAKAVIVLWSPAAAASDWVAAEAEEPRKSGRLIPAMIETCRIPRPYNVMHTADLTRWRGDRGNDGFPELAEAAKAVVEGRAPRRIPWRRSVTVVGVLTFIVAAVGFIASVTGIVDAAMRWSSAGAFAARSAEALSAGDSASPETQEGFRQALASLAHSSDLRTQRALTTLERGSREEAIGALRSLADDESAAVDAQMTRAASLWRQIGLLRFNEQPRVAREALERARRYAPDDVDTLTALGALYQREGRIAEADEVYRIVLAQGALSPSAEGRVRQVIGQAHLDRSDAGAAEREFTRALTLAQQSVDDMLEADLYSDLGLVDMERGAFASARQRFAQARDFALSFDYAASAAFADYYTAEAFIAEGRFDEAQASLVSAQSQAEALHESYLQLFIDVAAARLSLRRGEAQRALDIAERARARAAELGLPAAELQARMQMAEAQLALGQAQAAQQSAQEAQAGFHRLSARSAAEIAGALAAAAASRMPASAIDACASLAALQAPPGYARREIARIGGLARCGA